MIGSSPVGTPEAVVRRFLTEVVNGGDLDLIDQLWAEDMQWHGGSLGHHVGRQAYKEFTAANAAGAFAGMHLTVEDLVVAGDTVVVRFTNSGIHMGSFLGAPATGRRATWTGIGIYRVRDAQITEAWFGEDILGMLLQLGVRSLPRA